MKYLFLFAALVLSACTSAPGLRVHAETECVQTVSVKSLIGEFPDAGVSGCGQRRATGRYYTVRPRVEVDPAHITAQGSRLIVAPQFAAIYQED